MGAQPCPYIITESHEINILTFSVSVSVSLSSKMKRDTEVDPAAQDWCLEELKNLNETVSHEYMLGSYFHVQLLQIFLVSKN